MSNLTSRKFLLAVSAVISVSTLVAFGYITDGVYSVVMVSTVGGYLTANVVQRAA